MPTRSRNIRGPPSEINAAMHHKPVKLKVYPTSILQALFKPLWLLTTNCYGNVWPKRFICSKPSHHIHSNKALSSHKNYIKSHKLLLQTYTWHYSQVSKQYKMRRDSGTYSLLPSNMPPSTEKSAVSVLHSQHVLP